MFEGGWNPILIDLQSMLPSFISYFVEELDEMYYTYLNFITQARSWIVLQMS